MDKKLSCIDCAVINCNFLTIANSFISSVNPSLSFVDSSKLIILISFKSSLGSYKKSMLKQLTK